MARESKRKRDEKRFGKAELLADKGVEFPLTGAMQIEATNISNYYQTYMESHDFHISLTDDLFCVRPPSPFLWIEMIGANFCGLRFGWALQEVGPETKLKRPSSLEELAISGSVSSEFVGLLAVDAPMLRGRCVAMAWACLDASGRLLSNPAYRLASDEIEALRVILGGNRGNMYFVQDMLVQCMLAIQFMHCKNVSIHAEDPDPAINRERKKAGLKPFVRYHTINIEPMKKVLRTEGNIETEGLKKALHICRGHFATYSEEKPLFGKVAGTFWVPAHTRGSLKSGVVVSDYNVKAPKTGANETSARTV